jgi:hypothetical protein
MELAIPLVALGGLFVISNQKKETFKNKPTIRPQFQDPPPAPTKENKHFTPPMRPPNAINDYVDLAGRKQNLNDQTINMVPFFGKQKNIGPSLKTNDERDYTLDHRTGAGSLQISKSENAPLFKPQDNIQWATGAPNQSEFYQSRVNPSQNMNNVKPFQEEKVGPGMNQGYSSNGSGGFNSGMEARQEWLPKTVNELRVATKPKVSFELSNHQGPAQSKINNTGTIGKVEKYLPDKFYVNSPDRYLTTTGAEKASTLRSIQPDPTIHRATTTKAYAGVASNAAGPSSQPKHGLYRIDHRQQFKGEHFNPATSSVEQNNLNQVHQSIQLLPNNRTTTKPESFTIMKGLVNAITAPISDMLRPTRKETFGLTRVGALGASVPQHTPKPEDKLQSTIKETTTYSPYSKGQRPYKPVTDGGYQVADHQPISNQRDSTNVYYTGISGSTLPQTVSYEAEYNSYIKSNRANEGRIAGGNTQMYSPNINQENNNMKPLAHTSYMGGAQGVNAVSSIEQIGGMRMPQSYSNNDRNNIDLLSALKQNPYTHSII